ncbi:VOC family protein [Marinibactrum halimedae]|uniref:Glyoxalase n=1 Tax=Marinibactrum halimedae TaxID=1444977 RepID=A0AA37T3B4_9GAMM|nr:VOC family protein [Marinibactrum halimedae]MCD9458610.1 VOC family protein [Marinibactrum halimedae]GLS26025.1 glyoxalase [Marinibactrum halimedae]
MIGYALVGTNDLERSVAFYDTLLAEMGAQRYMEVEGYFVAWSTGENQAAFCVTKPYDGNPATVGNGVMIALLAESPEQVNKLYAKAIELGATDEGEPGPRSENFYAGYFRDLDGNKLNFFCAT